MRALAGDAVVERMHGEVDEGIGKPAIATAVVVFARAPGERLQRRLHRRPADLVEDAVDEDRAVISGGHGQASRLDALLLFFDEALRVARVARVHAGISEAGNAFLSRLAQELGLIQAPAQRSRFPRDQGKVCKANLTHAQCRPARPEPLQLLADADAIAGGAT